MIRIQTDIISAAEKRKKEFNISKIKEAGLWKKREGYIEVYKYPPYQTYDFLKAEDLKSNFRNDSAVIYVHFPFCLTKCTYCPFYSVTEDKSSVKVKEYMSCLKKEIELLSQNEDLKKIKIKSVYFGGGSPTYIPNESLQDFISFLKDKFTIKPKVEFGSEASPETVTGKEGEKKLEAWFNSGINRISIGVQDFNESILESIERGHNLDQAMAAIKNARSTGFNNINIDLIYGLPGQTRETWKKTVEVTSGLGLESVTVACLRIKPGERDIVHNTSMYWLFKKDPNLFPTEEEDFLLYLMMKEGLKEAGFKERQVMWFTKSKKFSSRYLIERRQNFTDTIALGVAAGSSKGNIDYVNFGDIEKYAYSVKQNKLPIFKGKIITNEEMIRKRIIYSLKVEMVKKDLKEKFGTIFDEFINLGLCYETSKTFELTDLGKFLSDEMCKKFFSKDVNNKLQQYDNDLDKKIIRKESTNYKEEVYDSRI